MSARDMPEVFREALALHMILQAGGVDAADIFVALTEANTLAVIVVEKGVQICGLSVGPVGMSPQEFQGRWPRAVRQLKSMSKADAQKFRDATKVRDSAVEILAGVQLGRLEAEKCPPGRLPS